MTGIKAFVGHSFTEVDEEVVRSFLTFFGQLEELLDGFEWTHAKKAEPKDLADKVLETIDGCNTLIAICTRKEMAVPDTALHGTVFSRDKVKASRRDFQWKTSDWVIQEIGMAIGRGFSIIILLEDGCRKPGGLQGDVEYVPFSRAAPEKAQGQLLEMIKALIPKAASAVPKPESKPSESKSLDNTSNTEEERQPDASWDAKDYEDQYFWYLIHDNYQRSYEINDAFLASPHANDQEKRATWKAYTESHKLIFGKRGKLSDIRECLKSFPNNPAIIASLASALGYLGQTNEAADLFKKSAEFEQELEDKIGRLSSSAHFYMKANNRSAAESIIENVKRLADSGDESRIARTLISIGNTSEDRQLEIEAMEAIARKNPDDHENRFSLAYAHSEIGNAEIALHHYLLIPHNERSAVAWNNLGVEFQNLSVPGRAIAAYRKSADEGETLAMSNLAYRYMNAGFFNEAKVEIRRALDAENPHRNVGEAYAQLNDLPENEAKAVKEIEERASAKMAFYRLLSHAILKPTLTTLPLEWIGPKGTVSVKLQGSEFGAEWEYETKGNALSGILVSKPNRYRVQLRGRLAGTRVYGQLKETRIEGTPSLLGDLDSERNFAIVFADDLESAQVVEDLNRRNPNFYELRRAT